LKLWIIYKEGIGFAKLIAEMLQENFEDYIDVSVGNAKKIDPSLIIEERLDFLIIGDIVSSVVPSTEISTWLAKYGEITRDSNFIVKTISGYFVTFSDISVELIWNEIVQDHVNSENVYPPMLCLKLNKGELEIQEGALEIIKDYSNEFISFFLNFKPK
jgi:hypothetical protein